jgi:AraC-like DNA-binding protein
MGTEPKPVKQEENLALRPGVQISASVSQPTGSAARDPRVLLNEAIDNLDRQPLTSFVQACATTYDTYDGQNPAFGPDWYAILFPSRIAFNCLEMTMGFAYRDGGWWTSLEIEVQLEAQGNWQSVDNLIITPPYDFTDDRGERRPFETHVLTFDPVKVQAVRVIGHPGGKAQFTSLSRLAVYHRNLSHWNLANLHQPPIPYIFRLISPAEVWDLSKSFAKLTNLNMQIQLVEHYLDHGRFMEFGQLTSHNYLGKPDLWFLAGERIGWRSWQNEYKQFNSTGPGASRKPGIHLWFYDTLAYVTAPVIVDDVVIATVLTEPGVILKDRFNEDWHRRFADEQKIAWDNYAAAIERTPKMTESQLEGALGLINMIVNSMASLAHRNQHLERELNTARDDSIKPGHQKKQLVRQAIDFMEEKLEDDISTVDVARSVALSPAHFSVIFTEQTGRNPSDFLIDLRIERAKEYLTQTEMSVMEICVALGYSPSYFSRVFKARTGFTPGNYARQKRTHA